MKTLKEKLLSKIQRCKKGISNRRLMLTVDGIGDPQRLVRFLQYEKKVRSEWKKIRMNGRTKIYKLYFAR